MKLGTVFSGIGAPEKAFVNIFGENGFDIVFGCDNGEIELPLSKKQIDLILKKENDKEKKIREIYGSYGINYMEKSYFANYKIKASNFYQDIRFLNGEKFKGQLDFFIGGSPCQSFSAMGHRMGLEDARGTLFYEFARIIKEAKPKCFIYENVPGMLTLDNGNTWKRIKDVFDRLEYTFSPTVLNSLDFGIPQNRKRLYGVGIRKDISTEKFVFPCGKKTTKKASDFYDKTIPAKYYFKETGFKFVTTHPSRAKINEEIIRTEKANQQFNWNGDFVFEPLDIKRHKEAIDSGAFVGTYEGKKGLTRKLTPSECLRLMGFKKFKIVIDDHRIYRQVGNSMVVNVMEAIVRKIIKDYKL